MPAQKKPSIKLWLNVHNNPNSQDNPKFDITYTDIKNAESRLQRFAPLLQSLFPELAPQQGLIESTLQCLPTSPLLPDNVNLWIKADHALPIAGSIKARGGIHEVLEFAEDLALKNQLITLQSNYKELLTPAAKTLFSQYSISVGSTGNLGLSIGVSAAALGFKAIVHMSKEAKEWKKEHLRQRGVSVIEHEGDYAQAVEKGRQKAIEDPFCHFVDDERSLSLFSGYAVAALRLQNQLLEQNIVVDAEHPLFVYIPCGVGGAPGGVSYGLKQIFGANVHCFFIEPDQSACFQVQLQHADQPNISIYDVGQTNKTEADGLAVPTASELAIRAMKHHLAGIITIEDEYLFANLYALKTHYAQKVEPSAASALSGPYALFNTAEGQHYLSSQILSQSIDNINHIIWTTGGLFMPESEYQSFLNQGQKAYQTTYQ